METPLIEEVDTFLSVPEFKQLSEFMDDKELDETMNYVIKLMMKPDVPFSTVAPLIVRLQAYSTKFKIQAKQHMLFNKTDDGSKKKNVYLTVSDALDRLVDSLKYLSRKS